MLEKSYDDILENVDINALSDAMANNGVLTGLTISAAGSNMSVDVAAGTCRISAVTYTEVGSTNLAITASHGTLNRRDIIIYDVATTNPAIVDGTAGADPAPPDIPAGDILLGIVYVDAAVTVIGSSDVRDSGVVVKSDNGIRDAVEAADDSNTFTDVDHTRSNGHAERHNLSGGDEYTYYDIDGAGSVQIDTTEYTHNTSTYQTVVTKTLGQVPATIKINFDLKCAGGTVTGSAFVLRNGGEVGVVQTEISETYVAKTQSIAGWSTGDTLAIKLKQNGTTNVVAIDNLAIGGTNVAAKPVTVGTWT